MPNQRLPKAALTATQKEANDPNQHAVHSKKVAALTSPLHLLDERQKIFVDSIIKGRGPSQAARIAGYNSPDSQGSITLKSPKIQAAIQFLYKKHEAAADVSRKKVMDGLLEAIDMAKMQADSGNMIAGWREIGRMCGYYAPEVKKIDINISAKRVIDKMETLSDEELLQMVESSRSIIEAEAIEVFDDVREG